MSIVFSFILFIFIWYSCVTIFCLLWNKKKKNDFQSNTRFNVLRKMCFCFLRENVCFCLKYFFHWCVCVAKHFKSMNSLFHNYFINVQLECCFYDHSRNRHTNTLLYNIIINPILFIIIYSELLFVDYQTGGVIHSVLSLFINIIFCFFSLSCFGFCLWFSYK